VKNQAETDVDCGGSCAPAIKCAPGKTCNVNSDCQSGVCAGTCQGGGLSVAYQVQNSGATSAYIGATLSVKNSSGAAVPLSQLKVRYYITDEVHKTLQWTLNWAHVTTGGPFGNLGVNFTSGALAPTGTNADTYLDFTFTSTDHTNLANNESADWSWMVNGPNQATDIYTQTNDYSYDASKTSLMNWTHVVLYQNGTGVWGALP
jgi:hypothetical protein